MRGKLHQLKRVSELKGKREKLVREMISRLVCSLRLWDEIVFQSKEKLDQKGWHVKYKQLNCHVYPKQTEAKLA